MSNHPSMQIVDQGEMEEPPILDSLWYRAWRHLFLEMQSRESMPESIHAHDIDQQVLEWAKNLSVKELIIMLDKTELQPSGD